MRKVTIAEVIEEFGEEVLSAHGRKRNAIWDTIDDIQPGEAVIFEKAEWTLTARPSQMLNRHYKKDGRKFRTNTQQGKIIVARIS